MRGVSARCARANSCIVCTNSGPCAVLHVRTAATVLDPPTQIRKINLAAFRTHRERHPTVRYWPKELVILRHRTWCERQCQSVQPDRNRQANGIEPYAYLRTVFAELPNAKTLEDVEALLPVPADAANIAKAS